MAKVSHHWDPCQLAPSCSSEQPPPCATRMESRFLEIVCPARTHHRRKQGGHGNRRAGELRGCAPGWLPP